VRHPVFRVVYRVVAVPLRTLLSLFILRFERAERDPLAVGRPPEVRDAFLVVGDRLRFASGRTDEKDLLLVTAISDEGDPPSVGRPSRRAAVALVGARELEWLLAIARDPELVVETVSLPVGGAHAEYHAAPVRRDRGGAGRPERDDLLERWTGNRRALGENAGGDDRQQKGGAAGREMARGQDASVHGASS
jgi:hypothetical protein